MEIILKQITNVYADAYLEKILSEELKNLFREIEYLQNENKHKDSDIDELVRRLKEEINSKHQVKDDAFQQNKEKSMNFIAIKCILNKD